MIKLIACILLLLATTILYGQETNPSPPVTKAGFLQKSKNQKTGAWILLGLGSVVASTAAFGDISFDVLPVLAIGGSAAIIGSIPLFIAGGKNKRRAMAATAYLQLQPAPLSYESFPNHLLPGVSIKLHR